MPESPWPTMSPELAALLTPEPIGGPEQEDLGNERSVATMTASTESDGLEWMWFLLFLAALLALIALYLFIAAKRRKRRF